jgi:hypothetical protein
LNTNSLISVGISKHYSVVSEFFTFKIWLYWF